MIRILYIVKFLQQEQMDYELMKEDTLYLKFETHLILGYPEIIFHVFSFCSVLDMYVLSHTLDDLLE